MSEDLYELVCLDRMSYAFLSHDVCIRRDCSYKRFFFICPHFFTYSCFYSVLGSDIEKSRRSEFRNPAVLLVGCFRK